MGARPAGWSLAVLGGSALVSVVYGGLSFLQTRAVGQTLVFVLVVPGILATVAALAWVARDAEAFGLPKAPWMVALVLAPGIGLVGYLIARELARRAPVSSGPADGGPAG